MWGRHRCRWQRVETHQSIRTLSHYYRRRCFLSNKRKEVIASHLILSYPVKETEEPKTLIFDDMIVSLKNLRGQQTVCFGFFHPSFCFNKSSWAACGGGLVLMTQLIQTMETRITKQQHKKGYIKYHYQCILSSCLVSAEHMQMPIDGRCRARGECKSQKCCNGSQNLPGWHVKVKSMCGKHYHWNGLQHRSK